MSETDNVSRQHAEIRAWFDSLQHDSPHPYYLHALVDGVLDAAVLPQIEQTAVQWACLYPDSTAEASSPATCPYLIDLTADTAEANAVMQLLFQRRQGMDFLLWIVSRHRLAALAAHFQPYAEVELPDRRRALFRYYDPSILQIVLRVLTPEQRERFLAAFRGCAYLRSEWTAIAGTDREVLEPLPAGFIALDKAQYRQLGGESFAETLYHRISDELQSPATELDSSRCIEHVGQLVAKATGKHGLNDQVDLALFVLTGLNVNLKFDEHPDVAEVLHGDPSGRERLHAKLARIDNNVWKELERERPSL